MKIYKQEKLENGIAIDPIKAVHVVQVLSNPLSLQKKAKISCSRTSCSLRSSVCFLVSHAVLVNLEVQGVDLFFGKNGMELPVV